MVSMVSDAVANVCLGDSGSASGPGQSSLVPIVLVVVGSIGVVLLLPIKEDRL